MFHCTKARSLTALDGMLSIKLALPADWDLILRYRVVILLDPVIHRSFHHTQTWLDALNQICVGTQNQRQCVLSAYHKRAADYRSQLGGDALAYSRFSPQQHAQNSTVTDRTRFCRRQARWRVGPEHQVGHQTIQNPIREPRRRPFLNCGATGKANSGRAPPEAAASAESPAQSTSEASVPTAARDFSRKPLSAISPPPSPEEALANILLDYGGLKSSARRRLRGQVCTVWHESACWK